MPVLWAAIGDIVRSRAVEDRGGLQALLEGLLQALKERGPLRPRAEAEIPPAAEIVRVEVARKAALQRPDDGRHQVEVLFREGWQGGVFGATQPGTVGGSCQ